jgi:ADP-heptose:LPS heptosyltransferase
MAAPTLDGLRRKYPKARIDLLINSSCAGVKNIIPGIDSFIMLDRQELQDGLVQADRPLFESFDKLNAFVANLNANEYTMVLNLTHNKLSGYLTSMVSAEDRLGLAINAKGQASFGSTWFKYLNDVVALGAETIFHYSDIFYQAAGLAKGQQSYNLVETDAGREEVELFIRHCGFKSGPKIVVQALTSDEKKNWGEKKWVTALKQIQLFESRAQIILLGAPSEKEKIHNLKKLLAEQNVKADIAILSLEGALSLLHVCDLLITGDTSIKHLASATPISVIEISLGSSDLRKTGAYKSGGLVIKSREACAPCDHNKSCHRTEQFCSTQMSAEMVGALALQYLQKDWTAIRVVAEEYQKEVEICRTEILPFGFWCAIDVLSEKTEKCLSSYLDRMAWQFLLTKEHLKPLGTYGSEGLKLKQYLELTWAPAQKDLLRISLDRIENEARDSENRLNRILFEVSRRIRESGAFGDVDFIDSHLRGEIQTVERDLGLGQFLTEKVTLNRSTGLYRVRQLQNSLNEASNYQQIKLKLLQSLKNQIMEYQ